MTLTKTFKLKDKSAKTIARGRQKANVDIKPWYINLIQLFIKSMWKMYESTVYENHNYENVYGKTKCSYIRNPHDSR